MIRVLILTIGLGFFSPDACFSQNKVSSELRFVNHMLSRNNQQEALFLLDRLEPGNLEQTDSINYLTGWILYRQKELSASAFYLSQVSESSLFYNKSAFFAAYNYSFLGETGKASEKLQLFTNSENKMIAEMANFQLAGIALLERETDAFSQLSESFKGHYNILAAEEIKLVDYHSRIVSAPVRSPFLAGLMSTAVPGLGKIYAGKTAEGISGFLYVGAMVGTSYDFYNRLGATHPLFILSATLSSIFYVGNIWGSAVAVKRVQNEFNYEMDQRILLDMHIPLRKLFP